MKKVTEILKKVGNKSARSYVDELNIPLPAPCFPWDFHQPSPPTKLAAEIKESK